MIATAITLYLIAAMFFLAVLTGDGRMKGEHRAIGLLLSIFSALLGSVALDVWFW